jgi:nitroimidazol reductase NimA-like FMN-containing flavoprotein (pyridoxamine 5'-phosphate oxidase superfamily)
VGRLGYVDQGWPTVVPVNYSTVKGDVFIRTLEGAKLSAAKRSDVVCLEIDEIDEFSRDGWSVVVHGRLEVITDPSALRMAWEHDPEPFVANERWHWLRLMPFSFSGRRVVDSADSTLPG